MNIYKIKLENLKNQKEPLWLLMFYDVDQKDIWNKTFYFYLTNEGLKSDIELLRFISDKTYSKLWNLANKHLATAQETLDNGNHFPLATIHKGKIVDLVKVKTKEIF